MLYKKYWLADCNMELMIPSDYLYNEEKIQVNDHSWEIPNSGIKISVNTKNNLEAQEDYITLKLQEIYLEYKSLLNGFSCKHIVKRNINGIEFGEMMFYARFKRFVFFNCLLFCVTDNKEVMISLQCIRDDVEDLEHIFYNIMDSIKKVERRELYVSKTSQR